MKKWLGVMLLACLPVLASANDMRAVLIDSIVPADTNTVRTDTVYSEMLQFEGHRYLVFASRIAVYEAYDDTNWTDDSFFVKFQTSFDRSNWTTHEVDTFLTNGASNSPLILDADADVYGNFGRLMVIHWDSIGTGEADSALVNRGTPFEKLIELFVVER